MNWLAITIASLIAFIATVLLLKLISPLAIRLELVDLPGGRKRHKQATPLTGGIAMFMSFCIAILLQELSLRPYRAFILCSFMLVLTGVMDDFRELTPRYRLLVQILVGVITVIWGHVALKSLGSFISLNSIQLNFPVSLFITVCATIGIINAINMLDGVDGLLGSLSIIQFGVFGYLAWSKGLSIDVMILAILIACLLGYLCFNFPLPGRKHALVFMGDAGSMFLGYIAVWFCIYLSQAPHRTGSPVVFLWIMIVPLYDIGAAIFRRLLRRKSPFHADSHHIHHLLQMYGFSSRQIILLLVSVTVAGSLFAIYAQHVHFTSSHIFIPFVFLFIVYFLMSEFLWRKKGH